MEHINWQAQTKQANIHIQDIAKQALEKAMVEANWHLENLVQDNKYSGMHA